jgi:hypothetical protein
MKNYIFMFLLILLSTYSKGQIAMTDIQIKEKTDSILLEGNLLFRYEEAAWVSNDLAFGKEKIKNEFGGYFVYQTNDTMKAIILNRDSLCILEYSFIPYFNLPIDSSFIKRDLTETENRLIKIKHKILKEIAENQYDVVCPPGYRINKVLVPFDNYFKLYLLTGTSQARVIPFGNDYLFIATDDGRILTWKKFHSRLLSVPSKMPNGDPINRTSHTHLYSEPFISATDICTFRLYASLLGQIEFSVYSPALSKWFKYKLSENTIEISDKF